MRLGAKYPTIAIIKALLVPSTSNYVRVDLYQDYLVWVRYWEFMYLNRAFSSRAMILGGNPAATAGTANGGGKGGGCGRPRNDTRGNDSANPRILEDWG